MPEEFRPLTEPERAIIERLLTEQFEGRDAVLEQIEVCRVRRFEPEHCGSLEFQVSGDAALIPGSHPSHDTPVPVEGRAMDSDGFPLEVLLFHRNGLLQELEIVVYSDRMKRMPAAADIEVVRR
jgi:hypothetical protein